METSKDIKDIKYNDRKERKLGDKIEFVKKNAIYFVAGMIVILIIVALGFFFNREEEPTGGQYSEEGVEVFEVNAYPDIMALIEEYYACYAIGDFETLQTLATPFSSHELAYMELLSQYVESYQNLTYYTKSGLDASSYMVNVYLEMKFEGVETLAPGLDFFYVRTNEEGSLYIDNSYSEYNMKNNDNPLDMNVHNLIKEHEQHEDLIALLTDTTVKFNEAIESDVNLYKMVNETIPAAASAWMAELVQGVETPESEVPETEVPENSETETEVESEVESESEEESEVEPESEVLSFPEGTVITIEEATKVRKEMTTESDVVATLYKGDKVTVVMSYAEGWTKVKWGNKTGYIRTDLLQ
ncbi:MAG: SH3 domain-containing protein [Roseburia sp.]|nr:SH3 domain-containing protein [Roseburia sp.]